jgi:hypothetical protein
LELQNRIALEIHEDMVGKTSAFWRRIKASLGRDTSAGAPSRVFWWNFCPLKKIWVRLCRFVFTKALQRGLVGEQAESI